MIIDSHAHIFPYLGGKSGYQSVELHRLYMQRAMVGVVEPAHRSETGEVVDKMGLLWDPEKQGIEGYQEVDFAVSSGGRLTWVKDATSYYLQFMPPWLTANEAPPELLTAMMEHAGIDVAVLQNDHIYGDLNQYFSEAVRAFAGRFVGLIQVDETMADREEQIGRLHKGTKSGLRGLFYNTLSFFRIDFREWFDATRFSGFWQEVEALKLPAYWDLTQLPNNTKEDYLSQLTRFASWSERHPNTPCLLVQAMPMRLFFEDGRLQVPSLLVKLARERGVLLELTLPIIWGRWYEYPFEKLAIIVETLYDLVGSASLVWGSDVPNVERYCTYKQSLAYLNRTCDFLNHDDIRLMLGGNLQRLFSL